MQNWHGSSAKSIISSEKELGTKTSKTDITLNAEEIESGMEFWLEYNTDFYTKDLIDSIKDRFIELIDTLDPPQLNSNYKTCFILAETTLGIKCAEILLSQNYHIYGIISPNQQVINWAKKQSIYSENLDKANIKKLLSSYSYEYLFSVVNSFVLDKDILATPIKMTINYHDSLLPSYAGLYATYWALVNNETSHGISWHIVDEGIDTGKILTQAEVKPEANDTSSILNMKCYEAALSSFSKMLTALENKSLNPVEQDLTKRSYYGANYRTEECCSITYNSTIDTCERLYRASNFGDNENPIANLKVKINNNFYIIQNAIFRKSEENKIHSLRASQDNLEIYLSDGVIIADKILDLKGESISIDNLASQQNWESPEKK